MTPEQFCYWFQGFAELSPCPPNAEQWGSIREHLQTVFKKVTPPVVGPAIAQGVQPGAADDFQGALRRVMEEESRRLQKGPYQIRPGWNKPPDIIC